MDKSKILVVGLVILVLAAAGLAFQFYSQSETLKRNLKETVRKYEAKLTSLTKDISKLQKEKSALQSKISTLGKDIQAYKSQIDSLKLEKQNYKTKYEEALKDKVKLKEELSDLEDELDKKREAIGELKVKVKTLEEEKKLAKKEVKEIPQDDFWADVVQGKTELAAKVEQLTSELRQAKLDRKEALQKKLELEIKLSNLERANDELKRQLDYTRRMVAILSRDFVREKENRRAMRQMLDKIDSENKNMKSRVMKLTKSETYLERQLAATQEERDVLKRNIEDMDTIVREGISNIMEMTDKISTVKKKVSDTSKSSVVDLPPIVVSKDNGKVSGTDLKLQGKVIAVNEANNFIVMDIGEKDGVTKGMEFNILRDGEKIARVKAVMVRKKICAADILDIYGDEEIQVGDIVK